MIGPPPQVVPEWRAPQLYETGGPLPFGLAVADLVGAGGPNTDGYPDLAVSNASADMNAEDQLWTGAPGTVRIFRNTADWDPPSATSLTPFQDLTVCDRGAPNEIAFANLSPLDSRPALVVAVSGITVEDRDPPSAGCFLWATWVEVDDAGLYVFRWDNILGRYGETPAYYPAFDGGEQYPLSSLAVADLNGDGLDDVAAGTDFGWADGTYPYEDGVPPFDKVFVWLNDGQGSLVLQTPALDARTEAVDGAGSIAAANFDATAPSPLADLVASTDAQPGAAVTLFRNQGAYPYPSTVQTGTGWAFWQMTTGKFNSAAKHESIAGSYFAADGVRVLHGDGAGAFTSHATDDLYLVRDDCFTPRTGGGRSVDSGMINGGTTLDLAATLAEDDRVGILLGKGDGTFQYECGNPNYHPLVDPDDDLNVEFRPIKVLIADLDQDGFGDLVTANHGLDDHIPPDACFRAPLRLITVRINKMAVVNPAP